MMAEKCDFTIASVNISTAKGGSKSPTAEASVRANYGIEGDAHAGPWHRQVSILSSEEIAAFAQKKQRVIKPGAFAENLTSKGLTLSQVAVFDRIRIGTVEMEITQIGKECHSGCAIAREVGNCIMPEVGVFGRVLSGGTIRAGMTATFIPRLLQVVVLTLSDRAYQKIYEDRSGPKIEECVQKYFQTRRDHLAVTRRLIPDEPSMLENELTQALHAGVDLVVTTGSTGVGPRDIAPEVTTRFCDKLIPGIMEYIRMKFGMEKPGVFLSRGVAGVKGTMLLLNCPGSVRGAEEYIGAFLPLLDHLRRMLYGIDVH